MGSIFSSVLVGVLTSIFAVAPSSTNYTLQKYDFGNGGGTGSSTNFKIDSLVGAQSGGAQTSTTFQSNPGEIATQQANVPPASTLSNPDSYYNRLRAIIDNGGNPSDTRFAIAISSDGFISTDYVQNDNSIGPVLGIEDYQTYATWGGGSGFLVLGLAANTTYEIKVKAMQGNFTETGYGPVSNSAATVNPTISFGVSTTLSGTPPFNVSFGSLLLNTVTNADADAVLSISSNASNGGAVYLRNSNAGLFSPSQSFTINSTTADLASASQGYGGQVTSTGQVSGGPISALSPFNGAGENVGAISTSLQNLATTPAAISGGSVTLRLKTKISPEILSATDYTDSLTFIAAMQF